MGPEKHMVDVLKRGENLGTDEPVFVGEERRKEREPEYTTDLKMKAPTGNWCRVLQTKEDQGHQQMSRKRDRVTKTIWQPDGGSTLPTLWPLTVRRSQPQISWTLSWPSSKLTKGTARDFCQ